MALTKLNSASMPTGSVIQTVQALSTDATATTTTATWVDVTPTATITPTSSSSKILVSHTAGGMMHATSAISASFQLLRGSTAVVTRGRHGYSSYNGWSPVPWSMEYLDSPNTTSAVTYKFQIRINSTGEIRHNDTTGSGVTALASSIVILQEIKG